MSTFYENDSMGYDEIIMTTPQFATNQVFRSREDLVEWVQKLGYSLGVVVVTKRSNKRPCGFVFKVVLICDRGGKYRVQESSKASGTKKINCPFELEGRYSDEYDAWTLTVICDGHNHQRSQYMEGHAYARRLTDDERSWVAYLTKMNVAPHDILSLLKERNLSNVSTIKTIYNERNKIRLIEQEGKSPMQVLLSFLHDNNYVYEFTTTGLNELENIFFVHPTSFDIWRAFPHILIIDSTYKTNKYNMPFVQIVGVTSTNNTFSIAFAFMHNEKTVNYTWVLNCLKLTLDFAPVKGCHVLVNFQCQYIPLDRIDVFWRKLDVSPLTSMQDDDVDCDDELQSFKESFNRLSKDGKRSWIRKLKDIFTPGKIDIREPRVQRNTRGRPSLKKTQQKRHDDPVRQQSCRFTTDKPPLQRTDSHMPPRHSSYVQPVERDYAQELTRHNSLRDHDNSPGYNSGWGNYETLGFYGNYDDHPTYNSAYVNTGEQTYFGSTSSVIDDLFGFNQNTAEQTYFTNTARVTEYDFMGLSQHSVTCQKSIDYRTYIGEIPEIFQPYVEDIENVDGDGNCGFRATAVALGYHQNDWASIRRSLIEEMVQYEQLYRLAFNDKNNTVDEYNAVFSSLNWFGKGFAPTQYWMIMPETGYLIANRFNVIFHFISKDNNSSSTIFPLWRGPDQFPEKRIITMALVHSNHYVAVKMQGEFPMGVTQKLWTLNRQTAASEWEQIYQSRQQLYKDWIWKPPLSELGEKDLKSCCYSLQDALKNGEESDLDVEELYGELKLRPFLPSDVISPLDVFKQSETGGFLP
ncbi:uncharacterized protein LOC143551661 [Bidens hawaiensis]|uniref:uncharacterized protein LOC143551661 n=1 Tax=Bidens hawaiensis TaxID=980011 RepID=UPI004049E0A7